MQSPNAINPDAICHQAVQAKLNTYQGLERFQGTLRQYNETLDGLVKLVGLMKNRILELEGQLSARDSDDSSTRD